MNRTSILFFFCSAVFSIMLLCSPVVFAVDAIHQTLSCTSCHATTPVDGQPVDFVGGDKTAVCDQCHGQQPVMALSASLAATAIVNEHSSTAAIPAEMQQWMISQGFTGDTSYIGCMTCHTMHGAPYPFLLKYDMTNGELCNLCHNGTVNFDSDWTSTSSRRVMYAPAHLGLADGSSEVPAPAAPNDGDTVSSAVNFPLAVFSGLHRTTSDIAYRITIPGSVFNVRDVNPANHMLWYYQSDMVTWDTTVEANGPYTVTITPYDPVTLVDANPVSFSLIVKNETLADKICTLASKIAEAGIQQRGIENSLVSKASNACRAAQSGNWNATAGILGAFRNQTEAQQGKFIPDASAQALIAFVDSLLAQIPQQ